jgi:quinol monooxygenase YgiN
MANEVSWLLEVAVKPGALDSFKVLMKEMVESTSNEPGTLSYEWFITDDGKAVHIYERYADSSATLIHLGHFGEKFAGRFLGAVDPTRLTVFGRPNDAVKSGLAAFKPMYLAPFGGFAR